MDETDGTDGTTQWTPAARDRYVAAAEAFAAAVRTHVTATAAREGRQREHGAYIGSAASVEEALRAFAEAEFDWCGSFPLVLPPAEDEVGAEFDADGFPGDDDQPGGEVLTVLGRWDYRVEDAAALIAAGRASYRRAWPDDTEDDAVVRVHDAVSAAGEVLHAGDVGDLDETPGLAPHRSLLQFVEHGGSTDEEFDEDPVGLVDDVPG